MVDNPFAKPDGGTENTGGDQSAGSSQDNTAGQTQDTPDPPIEAEEPEPIIIPAPEPYKPNKAHTRVAAILAEYNNIESDIPVGHDYWRLKREI